MIPYTTESILKKINPERRMSPSELRGARKAIRWINDHVEGHLPASDNPEYGRRVLNAIMDTLRTDYGADPQEVFSTSRKRELVYLRSASHVIYQNLTGSSQSETVEAFGNARRRATYPHMKDLIRSLTETYPAQRAKFQEFQTTVKRKANNQNSQDNA